MNKYFSLQAALLVAALLPFYVAQAETMPIEKAAYKAGKIRVGAESKAAQSACGASAGKARDVCVEKARAKEALDRAELRFEYTRAQADLEKLRQARAGTVHPVAASDGCGNPGGDDKARCIVAAKLNLGKT